MIAVGLGGQSHLFSQPRACQFRAIRIRRGAPCSRPRVQVWKLNREYCGLYFVQPKITSNDMMEITRLHSVFSESAQLFRQCLVSANNDPRIASSSKILRRVKAKQPNVAHGSSLGDSVGEWKFCADRLRGVFNQCKTVTFRNLKKRVHLAAQTKQMNRNHGADFFSALCL